MIDQAAGPDDPNWPSIIDAFVSTTYGTYYGSKEFEKLYEHACTQLVQDMVTDSDEAITESSVIERVHYLVKRIVSHGKSLCSYHVVS